MLEVKHRYSCNYADIIKVQKSLIVFQNECLTCLEGHTMKTQGFVSLTLNNIIFKPKYPNRIGNHSAITQQRTHVYRMHSLPLDCKY